MKPTRITTRIEERYRQWLERLAARNRESVSVALRRIIYAAYDSERRGA